MRFADGKVQTACVSFAEPTISGEQLLQRSGFKTIVDSGGAIGGAICSINDQGCSFPKQDCFCRCTGSQCEYWAYYLWQKSAWSYSQAGAAACQGQRWRLAGLVLGTGQLLERDGAAGGRLRECLHGRRACPSQRKHGAGCAGTRRSAGRTRGTAAICGLRRSSSWS